MKCRRYISPGELGFIFIIFSYIHIIGNKSVQLFYNIFLKIGLIFFPKSINLSIIYVNKQFYVIIILGNHTSFSEHAQ